MLYGKLSFKGTVQLENQKSVIIITKLLENNRFSQCQCAYKPTKPTNNREDQNHNLIQKQEHKMAPKVSLRSQTDVQRRYWHPEIFTEPLS